MREPEPNYTVYATNRYRHSPQYPVRHDVIGFGCATASTSDDVLSLMLMLSIPELLNA